MRRAIFNLLFAGSFLTTLATVAADDQARDDAIKKDRQRIAGTWRAVTVEFDGNKAKEEDARNLAVVNGPDGTWIARTGDMEIGRGTSTFDPTQKPKTIDFTVTEGAAKGNHYLGIYELGKNTRKMCFAPPGKERPTEFSTTPGSQHVFLTFERAKVE